MTSPAAVSAGTRGTLGNRPDGRRPAGVVVRALIALTKPRIIELLLVTTVPAMLLAQRGVPSLRLILVTLVGGTLAAGSANTINCYIDRDIDAVMKRTSRRPLVVNGHGTIKPWEALAWGIVLGAGATLLLGLMANWLAAALADAAIVFYIFIYTLLLKRRSPANIVIGGAERDAPGQGLPRLDGAVAADDQRAARGALHDRVDVAVEVAVDGVRAARGQRAAGQGDQDEPEGRHAVLGEQHGRHRGDQEQLDDPRLGQRDQRADHHARRAAAARTVSECPRRTRGDRCWRGHSPPSGSCLPGGTAPPSPPRACSPVRVAGSLPGVAGSPGTAV